MQRAAGNHKSCVEHPRTLMAKSAHEIYPVPPDAGYKEAARITLRSQFEALMTNLPGTLAGDDIEALHDMRVASRRLRAALSVFADAFPPKHFREIEKQVADVTDDLGAVRDADVQIEFLQAKRDAAPDSEKIGLDALTDSLFKQRDKDRIVMTKALARLEKSKFAVQFERLLADG